jgi:uncharacterized membrane protein
VLFDVLVVVFTVALGIAAIYIGVSVVLLPVWAVGSVLRARPLRRIATGWWELPFTALMAFEDFTTKLTASRDGSRWRRPTEPVRADAEGDWARGVGRFVLWVLAIVGGLLVVIYGNEYVVDPVAGSSAAEIAAAVLILLTASCGAIAWVLSERYRYNERPPLHRFMVGLTVVGIALSYFTLTSIQHAHRVVNDYCAYGSVSKAQLNGCKSHVTANDVEARDTHAARFAESGSSDEVCGARSGPFCEDVINRRLYEDQAPRPGE